jgi:aspartate-semialdehyde dehydrogenase
MHTGHISIIGGESLLGRELRELVSESKLALKVKLLGVDAESPTITEQDGEAVVITPLDEDDLRGSQLAFLAGSQTSSRKVLALAAKCEPAPIIIDLTYTAEEYPTARLRAPVVEPPGYEAPLGTLHVVAHPAAIALALFLARLSRSHPIRRSIAHLFAPATERGQPGIHELERQTVNLLSFKSLPKEVFDAQLSFNMLAQYGSEAPEPLEALELRVERHLATLLAACDRISMPSIRLIQAPVFHGYSISVRVEFEEKPDVHALTVALASPEVDVRDPDVEPPTNVGIASQGGIAVGSIAADRNDPSACWFWVVADNFRLMAENALAVGRSMLQGGESNRST